jgi:hypothetical protein
MKLEFLERQVLEVSSQVVFTALRQEFGLVPKALGQSICGLKQVELVDGHFRSETILALYLPYDAALGRDDGRQKDVSAA